MSQLPIAFLMGFCDCTGVTTPLQESPDRRPSDAIHQRQTQAFLIDSLTENGFYPSLIAFTEEIEQFTRIFLNAFADMDPIEYGDLRRRAEADVS